MPCKSKTNQRTNEQTNGSVNSPSLEPSRAKSRGKRNNIIAIDGPAGSGKSTVAKQLAKKIGFLYVDTGAMYRALTLKAVKNGINLEDEQALIKLACGIDIQLKMNNDCLQVMLDGKDVTRAIRAQALTEKVYYIAKIAGVRQEMVKLQRKLAKDAKGAVLEGRDIGTVVFPDAKNKFYLDAALLERTRRRHKELIQMGQKLSLEEITQDIQKRDQSDMTRDIAPLIKANDAVYIDTTDLTIEEVVDKISQQCSI